VNITIEQKRFLPPETQKDVPFNYLKAENSLRPQQQKQKATTITTREH